MYWWGGSETVEYAELLQSYRPQVEPSYGFGSYGLTSHLDTYFCIKSSHPTWCAVCKTELWRHGRYSQPSLSSVGLFKSFIPFSLSSLSGHDGSVLGLSLPCDGTTFVDCHSKEKWEHLFCLLLLHSLLSCQTKLCFPTEIKVEGFPQSC